METVSRCSWQDYIAAHGGSGGRRHRRRSGLRSTTCQKVTGAVRKALVAKALYSSSGLFVPPLWWNLYTRPARRRYNSQRSLPVALAA